VEIDIGTVLNHFDNTVDEQTLEVREYGLKFLTADGRVRTIRARKQVKYPKLPREGGSKSPKAQFNLKRNGAILVGDLDLGQPRTVKVASIAFFRNHGGTTWQPVRH